MSASYGFGDTSCPVCPFLIVSHLLKGYTRKVAKKDIMIPLSADYKNRCGGEG